MNAGKHTQAHRTHTPEKSGALEKSSVRIFESPLKETKKKQNKNSVSLIVIKTF